MKLRTKLILSVLAGLLAMILSSTPMWWGVLFSPITQQLTTAQCAQEPDGGLRWEVEGQVLRFRSLDLLYAFLHPEQKG